MVQQFIIASSKFTLYFFTHFIYSHSLNTNLVATRITPEFDNRVKKVYINFRNICLILILTRICYDSIHIFVTYYIPLKLFLKLFSLSVYKFNWVPVPQKVASSQPVQMLNMCKFLKERDFTGWLKIYCDRHNDSQHIMFNERNCIFIKNLMVVCIE